MKLLDIFKNIFFALVIGSLFIAMVWLSYLIVPILVVIISYLVISDYREYLKNEKKNSNQ